MSVNTGYLIDIRSKGEVNMKHTLSLCLFTFCLLWNTAAQAQASRTPRIITGSNVRVRQEPNLSAPEVTRLNLGTIMWELERTAQPQTIGQMQDYWYHVVLPDGQRGWVFGSLTMPFENERREEIYLKISRKRLERQRLSFSEQVDFFHFLTRTIEEVTDPEITAELKLAHLLILQRSLREQPNNPQNFEGWIKEQQANIYYNEPGGEWLVSPDLFWNLQEEYRVLLIADDIAWKAANNPLGGECEGYLPCYLSRVNQAQGRYLALYPEGKYASKALDFIAEYLQNFTTNKYDDYDRSDYIILQHEIDQLRPIVEKASATNKTLVLKQLDQITELHLQQK